MIEANDSILDRWTAALRLVRRAGRHGQALAWLLRRSPNILLLPGTSSAAHLRENVSGAGLSLSGEDLAALDKIGR
jgi:aryl-alcohol dehydrogenase-like predicted oxidoreductase